MASLGNIQGWTEEPGLSDSEIQHYYFHKFFVSDPETDTEKLLTSEDLMKAIKSYYDKLYKLEEIFISKSEKVKRSRQLIDWYKVLENEYTIQDVTHVAETYMLEFEMSAVEEKQHDLNLDRKFKGRKDKIRKRKAPVVIKPVDVETARMVPLKPDETTAQHQPRRTDAQCIESLIDFYQLAVTMENRIVYNWKECDSASPEKSSPEKASPEKYAFQEEPTKRIIPERMDFIINYKAMIRATLMLFKRMKPEFVEEAAKVYQKESTYVVRKHEFLKSLSKKSAKDSTDDKKSAKDSTDKKSPKAGSSSGTEKESEKSPPKEEKEGPKEEMEVDSED